jgi:hypothetical protein
MVEVELTDDEYTARDYNPELLAVSVIRNINL